MITCDLHGIQLHVMAVTKLVRIASVINMQDHTCAGCRQSDMVDIFVSTAGRGWETVLVMSDIHTVCIIKKYSQSSSGHQTSNQSPDKLRRDKPEEAKGARAAVQVGSPHECGL